MSQHYLDDVNFDFAKDDVDPIRVWPLFIALLFTLIIYSWAYVVTLTEPNIIYVPPVVPQTINGYVIGIDPGWSYACLTIDLSRKTIVGNRDCYDNGINGKPQGGIISPQQYHSLNNDAAAVAAGIIK